MKIEYPLRKAIIDRIVDEFISDGMTVGIGTGNTANYALMRIAERMSEESIGLICVSTSGKTEKFAAGLGIKMSSMDSVDRIDVTIDGADEIDPDMNMIKGLGGALTWEKIVASKTDKEIIVADSIKKVDILGTKYPLPVEVLPFAHNATKQKLKELGCEPVLRMKDGKEFITDSGNIIYDCRFEKITDPASLEMKINKIPGVVENGLFVGMAAIISICNPDGSEERLIRQ